MQRTHEFMHASPDLSFNNLLKEERSRDADSSYVFFFGLLRGAFGVSAFPSGFAPLELRRDKQGGGYRKSLAFAARGFEHVRQTCVSHPS